MERTSIGVTLATAAGCTPAAWVRRAAPLPGSWLRWSAAAGWSAVHQGGACACRCCRIAGHAPAL